MRRSLLLAVVISAGCSGDSATGPPALHPGTGCHPHRQECLANAARYALVRVNDRALPVASPWGMGDWDYDTDAGTWQVTDAEVLLFTDGNFSYLTNHRSASGKISNGGFTGRYQRLQGTVEFRLESGATCLAAVTPTGLLEHWQDGTTLVFESVR